MPSPTPTLTLRDLAAAGRLELLGVETEPGCWRPIDGSSVLKPDLAAVTAVGDYEDHGGWQT